MAKAHGKQAAKTTTGKSQAAAKTKPGKPQAAAKTTTGKSQAAAKTKPGKPQAAAKTKPGKPQAAAKTTTGKSQAAAKTKPGKSQAAAKTTTGKSQAAAKTTTGKPQAAAKTTTGKSQAAAKTKPRKPQAAAKTKPRFEAKFLDEMRRKLLKERAKYLHSAEEYQAEAETLLATREPGDVQFDEEGGEGTNVAVERERDLALSYQARNTVSQIDAALERIDDGTYGHCVTSGAPIPVERLRAIPWAAERVEVKAGGLGWR